MIRTFVIQKVFYWYSLFSYLCKTKVKWNSAKINYKYLLNKIVVSHTSIRYSHGIYKCITIWCVLELVRNGLLIAYLLRDLWDAIFTGYLSFWRYNLVQLLFNCISSGFPMALPMTHGTCRIYACCSVVLSLPLFHRR